jgi:hypothetical protein
MPKKISVTFHNTNDDSLIHEFVDPSLTCEEVRALWRQRTGIPTETLLFCTDYGALPEEGTLADILPEGTFVLAIEIEESATMILSCVGFPSPCWNVTVTAETTAADVLKKARKRLNVPESNAMRLLIGDRAVEGEIKIRSVTREKYIFAEVDIQLLVYLAMFRPMEFYEPVFEDQELVSDRNHRAVPTMDKGIDDRPMVGRIFLSDPAALMMIENEDYDRQRLLSKDRERSACAEMMFAEILCEKDLHAHHISLYIELSITLSVTFKKGKRLLETWVWPTDQISIIYTEENETLIFNGKKFNDNNATFVECGVCEDAGVEVVEFIKVAVRTSDCRLHRLTVDRDLAFPDFCLQLKEIEPQANFFVRIGETSIRNSTASLRDLGVENQMMIEIEWESRAIGVVHNNKVKVFHDVDAKWKFRDLLEKSRESFGTSIPDDARFVCCCGRIISNENEFRKEVPLTCCRNQIVRLEVAASTSIETSDSFDQLTCRLPDDTSLDVFTRIKKLVETKTPKEHRLQERLLLTCVLKMVNAKDVTFTLGKKIDFFIELTNEKVVPWTASPDERLSDVLSSLIDLNFEREVADFSGRFRVYFGAYELDETFGEAPVYSGQVLKVEPPPRPGEQSVSLLVFHLSSIPKDRVISLQSGSHRL